MVHFLLKPDLENFEHSFVSVWDECNCVVDSTFFNIAFPWDWNENWPFSVLWPLLSFPNLLAYRVQQEWTPCPLPIQVLTVLRLRCCSSLGWPGHMPHCKGRSLHFTSLHFTSLQCPWLRHCKSSQGGTCEQREPGLWWAACLGQAMGPGLLGACEGLYWPCEYLFTGGSRF